MTHYKLAHITDLRHLSDEDVANFARELPSIVAALRVAARASPGKPLEETFPFITYAPEIGDRVMVRVDGEEKASLSGAEIIAADHVDQALAKARRQRP